MDHEPDRLSRTDFAYRILDVRLGSGVEVLFTERRGIEVVEQLADFPQS
jgi:hypothetical protein